MLHDVLVFYLFSRYWFQEIIHHWRVGPMFFAKVYILIGTSHIQEIFVKQFLGERFNTLAVTLRGSATHVAGVTTLGDCGKF